MRFTVLLLVLSCAFTLAVESSDPSSARDSLREPGIWRVEWVQVVEYQRGCCLFAPRLLPTPALRVISKPPAPMANNTSSGCCLLEGAGSGLYGDDLGGRFYPKGGYATRFRLNRNDSRIVVGLSVVPWITRRGYRTLPALRDVMKANPMAIAKLDEFDHHMATGQKLGVTGFVMSTAGLAAIFGSAAWASSATYGYDDVAPRMAVLASSAICLTGAVIGITGQYVSEGAFASLLDAVDIYNGDR